MAKTKRTTKNGFRKTGKAPLHSRNIKIFVVKGGDQVRLAGGARKDGTPVRKGKDSKPIFLGRVYTGVNTGKVYPYASKKRGGTGLTLTPRQAIAVVK